MSIAAAVFREVHQPLTIEQVDIDKPWGREGRRSGAIRADVRLMNLYHIWCDLKPGVGDLVFAEKVGAYLGHLRDLAQLDAAFGVVASRADPVESYHFGVNALVQNATFALYRDFPDAERQSGAEKF